MSLLVSLLVAWTPLSEGVEYQTQPLADTGATLHVVRIDPTRARLTLLTRSEAGGETRRAGDWADRAKAIATINAGMFHKDYSKNVGMLIARGHINNEKDNPKYHSLLVFDPKRKDAPTARFVNRPAFGDVLEHYESAVQNLRLIADGENRWTQQKRRWSEAAVASDTSGRILFLFCRQPFTMYDLNGLLLEAGLNIVNAMHVEGGPEASLSVRGPKQRLDLSGSFETGFNENEDVQAQWPIPNVLAVLPR